MLLSSPPIGLTNPNLVKTYGQQSKSMVRRRGGLSRSPLLGRARIREGNLPRRRHGTGGRAGQHHRFQYPRREPAPEIEAVGSRVGGWINRRQPRTRRNRYGAGGALRVHGGGVGFHPELRHQIPRLAEMVRFIARLGGYIERPNSEPGPQTIWIGMQRMYDLAWAWESFGPQAKIHPS